MKRISLGLLIAAALQTLCFADGTNRPSIDEKLAHGLESYHEIRFATNLPPAVFKLCADGGGKFADPGQKWQESDVISEEGLLPWHRMIWAVTDGHSYIVHYESGGIAHEFKMLILDMKAGEVVPNTVQNGWVEKHFKDFREFLVFKYRNQ